MKKLNASLILLYDCQRRFLLQHRSSNAETLPDHWAFFGGGIEGGETPKEAIFREAFEELNYNLRDPVLVFEQDFTLDNVPGHMYVFIEAFDFDKDKSKLRLGEGQGWGWYKASEINGLRMLEHDRLVVETVDQYLDAYRDSIS